MIKNRRKGKSISESSRERGCGIDSNKMATGENKNEVSSSNVTVSPTPYIALDCEMVGVGIKGKKSNLARVSIVNSYGDCIYDKYVMPKEEVVDYRTAFSGITQSDLEIAVEFSIVQKEVRDLLKDRILVGHALRNDM